MTVSPENFTFATRALATWTYAGGHSGLAQQVELDKRRIFALSDRGIIGDVTVTPDDRIKLRWSKGEHSSVIVSATLNNALDVLDGIVNLDPA